MVYHLVDFNPSNDGAEILRPKTAAVRPIGSTHVQGECPSRLACNLTYIVAAQHKLH